MQSSNYLLLSQIAKYYQIVVSRKIEVLLISVHTFYLMVVLGVTVYLFSVGLPDLVKTNCLVFTTTHDNSSILRQAKSILA